MCVAISCHNFVFVDDGITEEMNYTKIVTFIFLATYISKRELLQISLHFFWEGVHSLLECSQVWSFSSETGFL